MEKIKIYSTPGCIYCKNAKTFFKENNIEFEDIDVSENQDSAREMIEKSGQMGVPVIIINENIIIGFNQDKIEEVLNFP
jgi:glutaredoxin-like YruB-family protein